MNFSHVFLITADKLRNTKACSLTIII